jgi:hypothetical protein
LYQGSHQERSPLRQAPESDGWRITKTGASIIVSCALFFTGYLYGVHKQAGSHMFTSHRGLRSPGTSDADNSLPVAPAFSEPSAPGDLLARAQLENELLYTDLKSFICNEQMDRYQAHLDGEKPHRIDTVNAKLSFENGVENYTEVRQNSRERPSLSSIPGAWSEGEFGTLLRQTRALLGTQPISLQSETTLNGAPAMLYSFEVSGNDSPWDLTVSSQQYRVPFETKVWVSKSSGQIMQIARTSRAIPPDSGISEIQWSVALKPVDLDGKAWLLPSTGQYSVLYARTNHREWNVINFSDYHRYTSRSVIHF